ncbi:related to extracellular GDSL-like lipase/acylhydrolase [Pseudozyma flocculosa]|uniref:Related to extracellular GDSL-like lipase/acylhydrolase n=2 Tax=Pseudozyma flocculosa TaxID=84751 RepID=A0A5C3F269_9BASI|nr:related to extracellular GDSL-like lipase/acylhydrolase [Pseudozyma flocculosa]
MPQLTEPANLPPPPFNGTGTGTGAKLVDATIRQTLKLSAGGRRVRLRLSNAFGGSDLSVSSVVVARPLVPGRDNGTVTVGVSAIDGATARQLRFSGETAFVIPKGALAVSDEVDIDVQRDGTLSVSIYLAAGQEGEAITSHPGSRTTTYIAPGDQTASATLTPDAVAVAHWYFLSGVEVLVPPHGNDARDGAIAILGDSLTDGRGSTDNANDRWPDLFYRRLGRGAYLNQAAGGNRILADGLGPNLLSRLDRDVLAQTGVSRAVVFEGVNDIGTADATEAAQDDVTRRLTAAYRQIVTRLGAHGLPVYGATITPFGNNPAYAHPLRERSRRRINHWIRHEAPFDAVLDFDAATRDPHNASLIRPDLDSGDGLHFNPEGYQVIADSIDLGLFV